MVPFLNLSDDCSVQCHKLYLLISRKLYLCLPVPALSNALVCLQITMASLPGKMLLSFSKGQDLQSQSWQRCVQMEH